MLWARRRFARRLLFPRTVVALLAMARAECANLSGVVPHRGKRRGFVRLAGGVLSVTLLTGCSAADSLQQAGKAAIEYDAGVLIAGERSLASLSNADVASRLRTGDFGAVRAEVFLGGSSPAQDQLGSSERFYLVGLEQRGSVLDASVMVVRHVQVGVIAGQEQGTFYGCGILKRRSDGSVSSSPTLCPRNRAAFTSRAEPVHWPAAAFAR